MPLVMVGSGAQGGRGRGGRQAEELAKRKAAHKRQQQADAADFDADTRDQIVGKVYQKLMEIESRLLPCGLHVVGCPPSAEEAVATLVNIAGIDREEDGIIVDKVAGDAGRQLRIQVRWRLPIGTPRVSLLFQSYLNARR